MLACRVIRLQAKWRMSPMPTSSSGNMLSCFRNNKKHTSQEVKSMDSWQTHKSDAMRARFAWCYTRSCVVALCVFCRCLVMLCYACCACLPFLFIRSISNCFFVEGWWGWVSCLQGCTTAMYVIYCYNYCMAVYMHHDMSRRVNDRLVDRCQRA